MSGRDFVRKGFCQEGILSGRNFVRKEFCQAGILKEFCQERFLSGSGLCQEGILSGKVFVRKRALPGRGSQLWSWVVVLSSVFFFSGGQKPVSFRAVKGDAQPHAQHHMPQHAQHRAQRHAPCHAHLGAQHADEWPGSNIGDRRSNSRKVGKRSCQTTSAH